MDIAVLDVIRNWADRIEDKEYAFTDMSDSEQRDIESQLNLTLSRWMIDHGFME